MSITVYRVSLFFVLACALTWAGWLAGFIWPSEQWPTMNPLGPLVAAPITIALTEGRVGLAAWLRRIARFRAPLWVYGAATLVPLAIIAVAMGVTAASGAVMHAIPVPSPLDVLIVIPILALMGPMPEEVTFRGHALPALQAILTPLAASLLIGIGVVVWHLPLIIEGSLAWPWIITIVLVSIVYTWLYNAGQSVWPLVTLHLVVNLFGSEFLGAIVAEPQTQLVYALVYAALYFVWAAAVLWRCGPALGVSRPLWLAAV
jgi:membrane protease YdiL (CAAX protease family)